MGSNFLGDQTRFPVSSSTPRKSKKSSKQPQRGLGVAQLEKIRMSSQMEGGIAFHDTPPHLSPLAYLVGLPDPSTSNFVYGEPIIHAIPRWQHRDAPVEPVSVGPHATRPFFESHAKEVEMDSMRSEARGGSTDIDLELRLSL